MIKKYIQKVAVISSFAFVLATNAAFTAPVFASAASPVHTFAASECTTDECRQLYTKYLNPLVRLLSAVVGVVVVLMIIVGGIQYSSAGSDPQKVAEARKKMSNAVFGLLAYIFLFAFLNWVVPGGVI